jgi:uncharacterized RmlC-like cupin family protein
MSEQYGEIKVTRKEDLDKNTAQSPGAIRMAGVTSESGAKHIWFGKVHNDPGTRSVPHHHGEAETAGYVLKGRARIYFGQDYKEYVDLNEGDFVFVPPYLPHIEVNLSDTEPLDFMTARSPDNIVINLPEVDQP